ncbi:MAG: glycerol dehydratase reactivase beta/small subunit family protein, partial [Solirubrobacteraceae bacterium]
MQPSSETDRPVAVWIVGPHPLPDGLLQPILWGLEEEGIPAETQPSAAGTVAEMAKLAADGSPLDVGIAVSGTDRAVALHHRDLAASQPLFVLRPAELEPALLRRLGANAARLVKGNPLAVEDEPAA